MRRVLTLALAAAANALALETRSIGGRPALLEMPTTRRRAKRAASAVQLSPARNGAEDVDGLRAILRLRVSEDPAAPPALPTIQAEESIVYGSQEWHDDRWEPLATSDDVLEYKPVKDIYGTVTGWRAIPSS